MGNRFKRIAKSTSFPAFVLFAAFIVINILVTKNFLTLSYMKGVAINNAPLICLTMGMSVVIISGGIDLSLGTMLSVVNTLCVTFTALGWISLEPGFYFISYHVSALLNDASFMQISP